MIRIDYQLWTDSMLYVGAQKPYGGNFMESWSHLPGGIVRGAVAHFLLSQCLQGEDQRPDLDPLPKRLEQLNRALDEQRALYSRFDPREPSQTGKCFFTIDFQSEAILVDRFGHRCTILSPELLWEGLGLTGKLPQPELVRSYTSPIYLGGWSTAWRMPKEVMLGVSAGSLFVYRVEEATEELLASLEQAEEQGLGERREEGLGRVVVCDPFHLEVMPV